MTERLRAVFDTNVFVSALLSRNPTSPTQELMRRWRMRSLSCSSARRYSSNWWGSCKSAASDKIRSRNFWLTITRLAEWVDVPPEAVVPVVIADPDDDQILACAAVGGANYLVTYDPHFDLLEGMYRGIKITKALPFLWKVRGDQPPGS